MGPSDHITDLGPTAPAVGQANVDDVALAPLPATTASDQVGRVLAAGEDPGPTGAERFGLGYVRLSDVFALAPLPSALDGQRRVAAPDAADRLVAKLQSDRTVLARTFPEGGVTYRTVPAGVHTEMVDGTHAVVSVWFVVVKSSTTVPPGAVWHTTDVSVVRTEAGWRAETETTIDGPAPASNPTLSPPDPTAYANVLSGFAPVAAP